jgi:hypothetical protein
MNSSMSNNKPMMEPIDCNIEVEDEEISQVDNPTAIFSDIVQREIPIGYCLGKMLDNYTRTKRTRKKIDFGSTSSVGS